MADRSHAQSGGRFIDSHRNRAAPQNTFYLHLSTPIPRTIKWQKGSELTSFLLHFSNAYFRTIHSTLHPFEPSTPLNASLYLSKLIFIIAAVASFYDHHQKLIKTQCVLYLQASRLELKVEVKPLELKTDGGWRMEDGGDPPAKGNMLHMHSPKSNLHTNVAKALHILHNHGVGERGGMVHQGAGGCCSGKGVKAAS